MADRYDPRPTSRSQGDRRATDARRAQESDDDPLIELARIVSGKGAFDTPSVRSERRQEPAAPRAPLPSESDLARDLESELLSELQASFSRLQEPLTAAAQAPQPAPPPQQTAQIIQAPVGRRRQMPPPPPVEAVPPPVQAAPPPPPPQRSEPRAERVTRAAPAPQAPKAERQAIRPANDADFSDMQFRPTVAPQAPRARNPEPPAPRQTTSRWGSPETRSEPRTEAARYAPQRPAARQAIPEPRPAPPPSRTPDYEDEAFDEPLSFQDETYYEDDPEAFDLVPGYGDDELLPPYAEEDAMAARPKRSGRGIVIVAGILAVVVAGGAAAIMLRSGDISGTTAPPIIAADPSPTKVAPETGQPIEDQGQAKAIYDRVVPGEDAAGSQLAEQDTDPVTDVAAATAETDSNNPISRVILPGGPGVDGPAPADTAPTTETAAAADDTASQATASEGDAIQPIGPKKVRTVVVRPDGTILSSEAAPADGSAPATAASAGAATEPLPGAETEPTAAATEEAPVAVPPKPASSSNGSDIAELETAGADGGRIAAAETGDTAAAEPQPADPTPVAEAPEEPAPAPRATERAVASAQDSTPMDLSTKSQPAAASGSGMLVQVSSQRSEEAALSTYRDLQKRFPSILGTYEANIQRADLGAKGVYYRVRVGPFAANDAQRLCDALKGAGGDCLLAQR